jgi:hypothetical protein
MSSTFSKHWSLILNVFSGQLERHLKINLKKTNKTFEIEMNNSKYCVKIFNNCSK